MRWGATVAYVLLASALYLLAAHAVAQPVEKKLIEYGWDVPAPSFVAAHIREMEQRPFDGLIMRIGPISQVFNTSPVTEADVADELAAIARIEWGTFTDNFLIMYSASTMDWFSDEDWEVVLGKAGMCAAAARAGRCKGVCFDYEPYGDNPWHYPSQKHAGEKSFEEYYAKVRQRGAQFMDAMQAQFPGLVMHTFFQLSYFGHIASNPNDEARMQALAKEGYGLLPAFINGLLDAAGPDVILTDGNESAYYYTEPLAYFRSFHTIRQTALGLVAPENRRKYLSQMQCAQALYVDYVFKYWPHPTPATLMTEEERAKWWEHNVYWALTTSDRYVWLYSEKMNWWTNENLPPGMEAATASAREKVAQRKGLGFDMAPIFERIRAAQAAKLKEKLRDRKTTVRKIPPDMERPAITGGLGKKVWQTTPGQAGFLPYADVDDNALKAKTTFWVAYDDQTLYLAVNCDEPNLDQLNVVGEKRDDEVWLGDSVDVFLATGEKPVPYYHIIINRNNVTWDAIHTGEMEIDPAWNPPVVTATAKSASGWSLEMAIPWAAIGVTEPKSGMKLYANVCRARSAGGEREYSSWSRCISGFLEPDRFGVWTLQ